MDKELLQQALDALEAWDARGRLRIIESIKARLAQPEPWVKTYSGGKPNYTQPIEPEPYPENFIDALRFDAAQSEPTIDGWPLYSGLPPFSPSGGSKENESQKIFRTIQQHEWVGLTDMEVMDICNFCSMQNGWFFVKEVEAKLKEKNGV